MVSQARMFEHTEIRRHMVTYSITQWMHNIVHRGQTNSSTWIVFGKQIPHLIDCVRQQNSRGYSWNLPSASNPFSIFLFLFLFSLSYPSSLSLALSPTFSFQSLFLPFNHLSFLLLFMLLEFHRWSDLRQWWLCKTQFKWMQDCHNENGIKGMHTETHLALLWHGNLVVKAVKYI